MSNENKMMCREDAESFLFKVDMEGLGYAAKNYAPKNTGDQYFEELLEELINAQAAMSEYVDELRDAYDIPVN